MAPRRGAVAAWFEGHALQFGTVAGEEKGRVVLVVHGGREARVPRSRTFYEVELPGDPPGATPEERRRAGERAEAARARAERRADEVDVPTLWELVRAQEGALGEDALAEIALAEDGGPARAAVALALSREGIRFQRRAEGWEPRTEAIVGAILLQREREAARAAERGAVLRAFQAAAAGEAWRASGSEIERRYLEALETVAVREGDVPPSLRSAAEEAISASGLEHETLAEGAFRLLRRVGRFSSDDENLAIPRHAIEVAFSEEVLSLAEARARTPFDRVGREDLPGLTVLTIDGPRTREVDDALSVEELPGGGWRVGVHVADPAVWVRPGDPLDAEARRRGTSFYFPDRRIPMLPPPISEGAASLVAEEERPSLSFFADVSPDGAIHDWSAARTLVRVTARLDYDAADRSIARGGPFDAELRALAAAAGALERSREGAGAATIRAPEAEVFVGADGRPELERRDPGTPANRLVAEAMILAGALAARFAADRGIPLLHRRQAAPDRSRDPIPPGLDPLATARLLRRGMRRGETSLAAGRHHGLGLPAYAQATSPLRRFQDLANHRQITAALRGEPLPYDDEALHGVAAAADRAETEGRRAERAQDRYWLLRWLEERAPCEVEAVVVETEPRAILVLVDTLLEEPAPWLAEAGLGDRVALRVERVNPRADRLVLRPV